MNVRFRPRAHYSVRARKVNRRQDKFRISDPAKAHIASMSAFASALKEQAMTSQALEPDAARATVAELRQPGSREQSNEICLQE